MDWFDTWLHHDAEITNRQTGAASEPVRVVGKTFSGRSMTGYDLSGIQFDRCRFERIDQQEVTVNRTRFKDCVFSGCEIRVVHGEKAQFSKTKFAGCEIRGTMYQPRFHGCLLAYCTVEGLWKEAVFESQTRIQFSDLRGLRLHESRILDVIFEDAPPKTKITQRALEECADYKELRTVQRQSLDVSDDLTLLRTNFSGLWQWLHLISFCAFAGPYAGFVVLLGIENHYLSTSGDEPTISILTAVSRKIANGGVDWRGGWCPKFFPIATFLVALICNLARLYLFVKTKALEQELEIGRVTPLVPDRLMKVNRFYRVLFAMSIVAIAAHVTYFVMLPVLATP